MRDKFRGCIVGTALGDAVGFLVEKQMPETCRNYIADAYMTGAIVGRSRKHRNSPETTFGQFSDDTQLSRELMLSLVSCGKWDAEDYAARISAIFREDRIVGSGKSTREAAARLAAGVPWDKAGTPSPAAGNGTAMRAAPIGVFYRTDYEMVALAAMEQSIITHSDPRCIDGSVLIAMAAAIAANNSDVYDNKYMFLEELITQTRKSICSQDTMNGLSVLVECIDDPYDVAVQKIAALDLERDAQTWKWIAPYVTTTALWSLWSFLNSMNNYEQAMINAIVCGGDVDSTAAITGALSGTWLGVNAIPSRYLDLLHDAGTWRVGDLTELADLCFATSVKGMS